eukprot:PLAT15314.1.p1 GENE.PLAT15314.1~~PLAT15314.1.p1  ORF type:complete len:412 (+),score=179.18 PLAT15314.1:34-1269(+)
MAEGSRSPSMDEALPAATSWWWRAGGEYVMLAVVVGSSLLGGVLLRLIVSTPPSAETALWVVLYALPMGILVAVYSSRYQLRRAAATTVLLAAAALLSAVEYAPSAHPTFDGGQLRWLLAPAPKNLSFGSLWLRDFSGLAISGLLKTAPIGLLLHVSGQGWLFLFAGACRPVVWQLGLAVGGAPVLWGAFMWLALQLQLRGNAWLRAADEGRASSGEDSDIVIVVSPSHTPYMRRRLYSEDDTQSSITSSNFLDSWPAFWLVLAMDAVMLLSLASLLLTAQPMSIARAVSIASLVVLTAAFFIPQLMNCCGRDSRWRFCCPSAFRQPLYSSLSENESLYSTEAPPVATTHASCTLSSLLSHAIPRSIVSSASCSRPLLTLFVWVAELSLVMLVFTFPLTALQLTSPLWEPA